LICSLVFFSMAGSPVNVRPIISSSLMGRGRRVRGKERGVRCEV
jgi:hypothetical protein